MNNGVWRAGNRIVFVDNEGRELDRGVVLRNAIASSDYAHVRLEGTGECWRLQRDLQFESDFEGTTH